MVLGQAVATSKMSVRTNKRKPSLIPGPAKAMPWASSTLPRTIRNRSARPRAQVKPGDKPASPPPAGTEAHNAGIWPGSFNTLSGAPVTAHSAAAGVSTLDALLPPTMYIESGGGVFLGLEPEEHARFARALQQAQEDTGLLQNADTAQQAASPGKALGVMVLRRQAARRARQVAVCAQPAHQKKAQQRSMLLRRAGHINQPRRFN